LRQLTGASEFNEVFLDDVDVPVDHLIGPEHGGWQVAATTLANERGASFVWKEQLLLELAFRALVAACRQRDTTAEPVTRQRLVRSWIDVEIFRLHNARARDHVARGRAPGSESSLVKLFWAGASQRLYETAVGVLGPAALLTPEDAGAVDAGRWHDGLLTTRANSIMGGTSEIQRTIIGERLLALPREPR